jgi:flagellar FliL protein
MNKKNSDTAKLKEYVTQYESQIEEIVQNEFGKYTIDEVNQNKTKIKDEIIAQIKDLFKSDFIINISFGSMLFS